MHHGGTKNRRPWYTSNHGATSTSSAMATFLVVIAYGVVALHKNNLGARIDKFTIMALDRLHHNGESQLDN
jgi:hypothetical protein